MTTYDSIKYKSTTIQNLNDTGTEGSKIATGTTAQRGSTTGQIRFNSTLSSMEVHNGTDFYIVGRIPQIDSISPTYVDSGAGGNLSMTVTGINFESGAVIKWIGSDASEVTADTTTVNSSTSITAVKSRASFSDAKEPYDIKITNPSTLTGQLDNAMDVDAAPVWTTASGKIADVVEDVAMSTATVAATDADGDTVAYSVASGTLPTGLSLNSANGQITGTPNVNDTYAQAGVTHTFDLRATSGGKTSDRTFNILRKWNDGASAAQASASAVLIKSITSTTTDGGYYIIDPSDASSSIYAYCNMSFDGGGWVLVHSSRSSTWDGTSGSQSTASLFNTSTLVEYTSGVPHDIYSKLRTNYPHSELLIEWSANSDMSSPNRPVYSTGSQGSLIGYSNNSTFSRKGGNSEDLPNSAWGALGSENDSYLYYKKSGSGQHRNYMYSNHNTDGSNQGGFYWWQGSYSSGEWVSSPSETVATVSFYVK